MSSREKPAATPRIDVVLPGILARVGQHHAALETIRRRWPRLVGRELAAHSAPISVRRKQLVVAVSHPGESFALNFQKEALSKKLEGLTKGSITGIIIRPGETPHAVSH